jgi:hypothetical protein
MFVEGEAQVFRQLVQFQKGEIPRLAIAALMHRHDRPISRDSLEHLEVAEVDHDFDLHAVSQEDSQVLARPGSEESQRGDEAKPSTLSKELDAALVEIGVKIGAVRRDDKILGQPWFDWLSSSIRT